MRKIENYIQDPMTATKIYELMPNKDKKPKHQTSITAEKIYYWMISCNIPEEYRKWHLNQLITLIKVFDVENDQKKMSSTDSREWRKAQNMARRNKFHSKG